MASMTDTMADEVQDTQAAPGAADINSMLNALPKEQRVALESIMQAWAKQVGADGVTAERPLSSLDELDRVQDADRDDKYEHLVLTDAIKNTVFYTKLEAREEGLSDTQHDKNFPWVEVFTGLGFGGRNPTLQTGETISEDEGLIFTFHGTYSDVVALDLRNMLMMNEQEAQLRENMFSTRYPRYSRWDFRIHDIVVTDGPERRMRLQESNEQQRARAEETMLSNMNKVFENLLKKIEAAGGQVVAEDEVKGALSDEMLKDMEPEQVAAWRELGGQPDEAAAEKKAAPAQSTVQVKTTPGGRTRKKK